MNKLAYTIIALFLHCALLHTQMKKTYLTVSFCQQDECNVATV